MTNTIETINVGNMRARIVPDPHPEAPENDLFQIAYTSDRYALGTENVSRQRMGEIVRGIHSGKLLGWPVFAYVHSGATIKMADSNPFTCPWDSGQCGYIYCDKAKFLASMGRTRLTPKALREAREYAHSVVTEFDQYLTGDVYGVIVEEVDDDGDATHSDSCWGFYGLEHARESAKEMAESIAQGA